MKGKNIRKEKAKKPLRPPVDHNQKTFFTDWEKGIDYRIVHNNCEAEVRLRLTDELVGVYKAATRSWRKVQSLDYLTHGVRVMVEGLYT